MVTQVTHLCVEVEKHLHHFSNKQNNYRFDYNHVINLILAKFEFEKYNHKMNQSPLMVQEFTVFHFTFPHHVPIVQL